MAKRKNTLFWASFADLMTTLFFVMLALYAVTFVYLQKVISQVQADAQKYQKILDMEASVQKLEETGLFRYEKEYKRHILTQEVFFDRDSATIKPQYFQMLKDAGIEISNLLNNYSGKDNIKYLVIIEGMSSRDRAGKLYNYQLSYRRAYSLFNFWDQGVWKDEYDINEKVAEIIISGSGTGGVGRSSENKKNQRFLIQLIPKIQTDNE